MAKQQRPRSWKKAVDRATRALAANKQRIESASSSGIASNRTLQDRAYDPDPTGGGQKLPQQSAAPLQKGKRRKRR